MEWGSFESSWFTVRKYFIATTKWLIFHPRAGDLTNPQGNLQQIDFEEAAPRVPVVAVAVAEVTRPAFLPQKSDPRALVRMAAVLECMAPGIWTQS